MLTWVTMHDQRVCPICLVLEGYQWIFETGKDNFPSELSHPQFGIVWTIASGSDAHGHHNGTCRCNIEHQFDFSDITQRITRIANALEQAVQT